MIRLEQVLAATDLSAPARHAAERAALVAKDASATLHLVHVINDPALGHLRRLLQESRDDVEPRIRRTIDRDVVRLGDHLAQVYGVTAQAHVVTGALITGILGHAAASRADLLVLGAHGASFMRHLMLGSTAERLIRKSDRPLLVVKQPPHERYRRALVAVDFSRSSLATLTAARAVAPQADLVLLHAYEVPFEDWMRTADVREDALLHYQGVARQRASVDMRAFLQSSGLDPAEMSTIILKGDPTLRILEQEQELDCDLVVIGKQGETVTEELLLGAVTKHVLQQSQSDVLISV
jgi:nucleotide-binding universal stress UspA family protein